MCTNIPELCLKLILSLIHRVHQLIQPFLEVENCFDQAKDHQTNPVSSNINLGGQDHHDDKTSVNRGTAVKAPASHHHDHPDEDRNKRKNDQAEAEEKDPDDRRLGDHHRPPLSTQSLQFLINSFPSSQPACPVSIDFLARFQSPQDLILSLKLIISTIALNHLITIDDQLKIDRPYTLATIDRLDSIPVFGSKDIKLLQSLAQTVSNWLIYHQLKSSTAIDDQVRTQYSDRKQSIQEISQDSHQVCFSGLSFHQTVRSLVRIILPPELDRLFDHHSPQDPIELKKFRALILLHPRFALHHALFQVLLIPLIAGLLRLRLDRNLSACVDHYLHRLLDLADPKLVFSSLLSLATATSSSSQSLALNQNGRSEKISKQLSSEISQVLSIRLLRPSGLRGLLQSVMTDDYFEDEDLSQNHDESHLKPQPDRAPITSASLKRAESLYHLLSHPSTLSSDSVYWNTILKNLIEIILPDFAHQLHTVDLRSPNSGDRTATAARAPDSLRRTACYVLNQVIVRQPQIYKSYLSSIIHAAFRPKQPSAQPTRELGLVVVSFSQINLTIQLINQLVLNSDPSQTFIDRLLLPILPQLLSMSIFLCRTKGDPILRQLSLNLIRIWIKLNQAETVAEMFCRSIRELEAGRELNPDHDTPPTCSQPTKNKGRNQWARDDGGMCCIKFDRFDGGNLLEFNLDPSELMQWFDGLNNLDLLGLLLGKWLIEIELLRTRSGFQEAKMILFRIQVCLKLIDSFDCSSIIKKHPSQVLGFICQSLKIHHDKKHPSPSVSALPDDLYCQDATREQTERTRGVLDSLKCLNLGDLDGHQTFNEEEDIEEGDLDRGIMLAGLTLFVTLFESISNLDEQSTAILHEISSRLDELLLNNKTKITPEVYDLAMKSRLIISVHKALAEVEGSISRNRNELELENERERRELENKYTEGLKLVADECLPLRSQGIGILKEVLLSRPRSNEARKLIDIWAVKVIEVLLQMIEEDDSFVYLNAIKGLSALAERYHHPVCLKLNLGFGRSDRNGTLYPNSLSVDRNDVDRRLRIGEAMVQIIQRAGSALPIYIDRLIPSLLLVLHSPNHEQFPGCIKTSALTTLTTCIESSLLTMMPYLSDLIQSCLTILNSQIGSSSLNRPTDLEQTLESVEHDQDSGDEGSHDHSDTNPEVLDDDHEDRHLIKLPDQMIMLRRAAIFLIEQLLNQIYQLCSQSSSSPSRAFLNKIKDTLAGSLRDIHRVLNYHVLLAHQRYPPIDPPVLVMVRNSLAHSNFIMGFFTL